MFLNISFTLISYIITLARSWRKTTIIKIFFAQKSFCFNIFLLLSHVIWKTIILLCCLIVNIFWRIDSALVITRSCIKFTISFAFIFYTFSIFESLLIYIIIFIFLVSFRFNNAIMISSHNNIYIVIENAFLIIFA